MIIDLSLPGITIRPFPDLNGEAHFCEVFFDDVDLPDTALIGTEGSGWEQVTAELAFERCGPERLYSSIVLLDEWLAWLRSLEMRRKTSTILAGTLVSRLAVLRAMSLSVMERLARGENPMVEAALVKDLGTELEQTIPTAIADALGETPGDPIPESLVRILAFVTHVAPSFSLRGGTREILRGIIARGLGLR